jgi:3-deoxy-D-manno-octulosonic-acid transferase
MEEILRLDSNVKIVISSTTAPGIQQACKAKRWCNVINSPVDFPRTVRRALKSLCPSVYVCMETELWPNILWQACRQGVDTAVLNGRLSDRSFPVYMKIRGLVAPLLKNMSLLCVTSEKYARRFIALGAEADRVKVCGNVKYGGLLRRDVSRPSGRIISMFGTCKRRVWVAGSIRHGEEAIVARAHRIILETFPDAFLFVAPRHLDRVETVRQELERTGLKSCFLNVAKRFDDVSTCIVNTIGDLFDIYGVSSVAFVGGSLVCKGGQNIMEPAAWGMQVIHGPWVSNFEDAADALKAEGGAVEVRDCHGLAEAVIRMFSRDDVRNEMGRRARRALEICGQDAAIKQAKMLLEVMKGKAAGKEGG